MENENKVMSFKEQLLHLVQGMKKDDFDFENEAAVFNWTYDETPELQFQLVIFAKGNSSVDTEEEDDQLEFDFGTDNPEYLH